MKYSYHFSNMMRCAFSLIISFFVASAIGQPERALKKAIAAYESRDYQGSIDIFSSILNEWDPDDHGDAYYNVLFESSRPLIHIFKYKEAEIIYDQILDATADRYDLLYAKALNAKMVMHDFRGEIDELASKAQRTLSLGDIDPALYSDAHSFLGRIYTQHKVHSDSAAYHFDQAILIDSAIADSTSLPWSYWDLGRHNSALGNIDLAITHYISAINATPAQAEYKTSQFYIEISKMFLQLRNIEKAGYYGEEGLRIAKKHGLGTTRARALLQLSEIDLLLDQPSVSLTKVDSSIAILLRTKNKPTIYDAYLQGAAGAIHNQNIDLASNYLSKVPPPTSAPSDIGQAAQFYFLQGALSLLKNDLVATNTQLSMAEKYGVEANNLGQLARIYLALYKCNKEVGRLDSALSYYECYTEIKDQLYAKGQQSDLFNTEAKYQIQYKNQEIELLAVQNQLHKVQLTQRRTWIMLLIVLSLLLSGVALVIHYMSKQKRRVQAQSFEEELTGKNLEIDRLSVRIYEIIDQNAKEISLIPITELNTHLSISLTEKEYQVLDSIAKGKTNKETASQLYVSENTIKFHLKNIYNKLDVNNRKAALSKVSSIS